MLQPKGGFGAAVAVFVLAGCAPTRAAREPTLRDFVRARCATDGHDALVQWRGAVYAETPAEPVRHLFDVVGVNVARCLPTQGGAGWLLTSREIMLYLDPDTGAPFARWHNPWTAETVPVVHVANRLVQAELKTLPRWSRAGDLLTFAIDVFPFYPSPLATQPELAPYSAGSTYQSAELFAFTVPSASLGKSAPIIRDVAVGWQRIGPWLPWMKMGERPGRLIYSAQGARASRWQDLPAPLRDELATRVPLYRSAPRCHLAARNSTSWTYFAKHHAAYLAGARFPVFEPPDAESCSP